MTEESGGDIRELKGHSTRGAPLDLFDPGRRMKADTTIWKEGAGEDGFWR